METRKVQVTGGSTYTVSLPKGWATDNGIKAGSTVAFYPEDDVLVLSPTTNNERETGTLDVTDLDGDELVRAVMTMYVSGFDIITLAADRITTDQRRSIREATQSLVGLEVLEETADRVVIQDLLDSSELSIHNAITRMRLIATSMMQDAVIAIAENDEDLARDIIERDDDVDRLWYVVSRIFRETLRSPTATEELGLPREVCFDYHSSARQLERIADHAAKIARVALNVETVPTPVVESLSSLHDEAASVIETALEALFTEEPDRAIELANDARRAIPGIDERVRAADQLLHDSDPRQAQQLGLVVDSLSRSADYGGNIAETALQKAAPKP